MSEKEWLLVCLMEELAETSQRVSKALRFGVDEIQPGQPLTNMQRIAEENADVLVIMGMLAHHNTDISNVFSNEEFERRAEAKVMRVLELIRKARESGIIKP